MPIDHCPFVSFKERLRPYLALNIINPHTKERIGTFGLIDTGADECAIPAGFAHVLGHNLLAGTTKTVGTGNGVTIAYSHTTKFEIYHPTTGKLLHTIPETPIDFMPNLHMVLLGVNSFLSNFVLKIDYPQKAFSIKHP